MPGAGPDGQDGVPLGAREEFDAQEASLVAALREGDPRAFREAVVRYGPHMLAVAQRIVGAHRAEDIVQEAWLVAYRKIRGFQERSALRTWLHRIVTNLALSELRRPGREVPGSDASQPDVPSGWFDSHGHWAAPLSDWGSGSPDEVLTAEELQACIDKHLAAMPESQRLVVTLRDLHLQEIDEICNELNLSASNVRVLLHRGRVRLMNMVNGFKETGSC